MKFYQVKINRDLPIDFSAAMLANPSMNFDDDANQSGDKKG